MPAVTVENILTLARIPDPDAAGSIERRVLAITTAPKGVEGEGFPVRRAFYGLDQRYLDPFIHMDQMGEVEYGPGEPKGTAWHPHRGFETVTYMIDGTFQHQDSTGGGGLITIQLWVNLPSDQKWTPPRYQDIGATRVTLLSSADGGALVRVIAGDVAGHHGPGVTHTAITLLHATISPGAELRLPWRRDFNGLAYVLAGRGTVGAKRAPIGTGQLAAFGAGDVISLTADLAQESRSPNLDVLVLGGEPIGEPVAWYGPFVMNTHEELAQAFDDYRRGRMGTIPAAHIGD